MVFDTMVIAYALLRVPGFWEDSLKALEAAEEILVPDLFRAEFLNVVSRWVCARQVSLALGLAALQDAEKTINQVVPADWVWEQALELAVARRHSAYDMLFVALAAQTDSRLVSYDRRLLKLCPEYAISVSDFLRL